MHVCVYHLYYGYLQRSGWSPAAGVTGEMVRCSSQALEAEFGSSITPENVINN